MCLCSTKYVSFKSDHRLRWHIFVGFAEKNTKCLVQVTSSKKHMLCVIWTTAEIVLVSRSNCCEGTKDYSTQYYTIVINSALGYRDIDV